MKNTLLLMSLFLFIQSCRTLENKEVLSFENKKYTLSRYEDREKILQKISSIVSNNDIITILVDFKILKNVDIATKKEYIYLLATDAETLHKVAVLLKYDGTKREYSVTEKTFVLCSGSTDCNPSLYNNHWGCDSEVENFDCKKSVTII